MRETLYQTKAAELGSSRPRDGGPDYAGLDRDAWRDVDGRQYELALPMVPRPLRAAGIRSAHAAPRCGSLHGGRLRIHREAAERAWRKSHIDVADGGSAVTCISVPTQPAYALPEGVPEPNLEVVANTRGEAAKFWLWVLQDEIHKYRGSRVKPLLQAGRLAECLYQRCGGIGAGLYRDLVRNPARPGRGVTVTYRAPAGFTLSELADAVKGMRTPRVRRTLAGQHADLMRHACRDFGRLNAMRHHRVLPWMLSLREANGLNLVDDAEVSQMASWLEDMRRGWERRGHAPRFLARQAWKGRRSGHRRRERNAGRDARIRELRSQGMTQAAIAAEVGLSQRGVGKVLAAGVLEPNLQLGSTQRDSRFSEKGLDGREAAGCPGCGRKLPPQCAICPACGLLQNDDWRPA